MRALLAVIAMAWCGALPLQAQQDARARVEYIAGGTLYLEVAEGTRWIPGDTVRIAPLAGAEWTGRVRVQGAAATRISAEWLGGRMPFAVGDSVRIEAPRAAPEPVPAQPVPAPTPLTPGALPAPALRERTLHAAGRVGLELDALRTAADWEGARVDNTSLLGTLRLRGTVSGLPGGVALRANLRGAYRHDEHGALVPARQLFASELSLERTGRRLQLQAGRFANPYELYSGYLDGALLRVGSLDGFGAGAAYGFDPRYGNQGIDTERRKLSVFADLHRSTASLRYDGDVSLHRAWEGDTLSTTAVGITQQLGIGRVRLTQLLRADDGDDGWTLGLAQLGASAPLGAGTRLRLRFTHDDPHAFFRIPAAATWRTRRAGAALTRFGEHLNAGADVTFSASERGERADTAGERRTARTVSAWLDLPRSPLAGLGAELYVTSWSGYGQRTLTLAPGLHRTFGRTQLRTGYQLYHHERGVDAVDTHSITATLGTGLGRGELDVHARHDWGGGLRSTRVLSGFWVAL